MQALLFGWNSRKSFDFKYISVETIENFSTNKHLVHFKMEQYKFLCQACKSFFARCARSVKNFNFYWNLLKACWKNILQNSVDIPQNRWKTMRMAFREWPLALCFLIGIFQHSKQHKQKQPKNKNVQSELGGAKLKCELRATIAQTTNRNAFRIQM